MHYNLDNDRLAIVIGTNYIKRVKDLVKKIELERKQIKLKYDFLFPPIRIVDDGDIPVNGYQIKMRDAMKCYGERRVFRVFGLLKDLRKVIIENKEKLQETS
jgi:flagellar biosynthesis component FlhA